MTQVESISIPFLKSFYNDAIGEHRFALWTKHNKSHTWHSKFATGAKAIDPDVDTYFSMALFPKGVTRRKQEKASAIFGVWLDVDCGKKDNGQDYFPTVEEALDWTQDELAGKWTTIVHSGRGLHVYLKFDETLWIENDNERIEAQKLVKGFHRWADKRCPFTIDSLIDLSRVMRVPGTMHTEGGNLCHVIDEQEVSIAPSDLSEFIPAVQIMSAESGQVAVSENQLSEEDLKRRINLLIDQDITFSRTWKRARRLRDKSPSGFCMAIANYLVMSGFPDSWVMDSLKMWRNSQTDAQPKPEEWYMQTIMKARASNKVEAIGNQVSAAATDEVEEGKLDVISEVFGREVTSIIRRVVPEYMGKKEKSTYVFNFDKSTLIVPSTEVLMAQNRMKILAFEQQKILMAHLKGPQWNAFLSIVLEEMEDVFEEVEGNLAFNLYQELRNFLKKKQEACSITQDLGAWDKTCLYEEDGIHYFAWSTFKRHVSSAGYTIGNKELASLLKGLGCKSRQFSDSDRTRLWQMPTKEIEHGDVQEVS